MAFGSFSHSGLEGGRPSVIIDSTQARAGRWLVTGRVRFALTGAPASAEASTLPKELFVMEIPFRDAENEKQALVAASTTVLQLVTRFSETAEFVRQHCEEDQTLSA